MLYLNSITWALVFVQLCFVGAQFQCLFVVGSGCVFKVVFASFVLFSFGLDSGIFGCELQVDGMGAFDKSRLCLCAIPDGVLIWLILQAQVVCVFNNS